MFILITLRTTFIKQQTQIESTHQTAWLGWGVLMPGREQASPGPRQLRSWAAGDTDAALTRALAKIGAVVGKMCLNGSLKTVDFKNPSTWEFSIFFIELMTTNDAFYGSMFRETHGSLGQERRSALAKHRHSGSFCGQVVWHLGPEIHGTTKAGGCRWRWADLLGRVQGGSHLMTCQFFFQKNMLKNWFDRTSATSTCLSRLQF